MRYKAILLMLGLVCVCWTSLAETEVEVGFTAEPINATLDGDPALEAFLKPYRDGVRAYASEVIGVAAEPLSRRRPECGLSNLVADSLRVVAEKEFERQVDLAVTNFGGLRRNLPKGPLTMGLIMELSPFDNYLVLMEVKGELILELASNIASGSASAISGLKVVGDKDGELVSATIAGEEVSPAETYQLATIDYLVANWRSLFREEWIVRKAVSVKLRQRDAIVLHLSGLTERGVKIYDTGEGRVLLEK